MTEEVKFPIVIELKKSIKINDIECTSLKLREPTVADMELSYKEDDSLQRSMKMLALVAGITNDDVRNLGIRDYVACDTVLGDFFQST